MKFQEMALRRSIIKRSVCTKKMQIQSAEFALARRRYHQEEEEEKNCTFKNCQILHRSICEEM